MAATAQSAIAVIGIDIGKNSFHVIGLDGRGAIVLRQKWSRGQVEARFANMSPCRIGMEGCVGAHHLSRKLKALGRDARLMLARYVRPYSKGQKNDLRDAEAIAVWHGYRKEFNRLQADRLDDRRQSYRCFLNGVSERLWARIKIGFESGHDIKLLQVRVRHEGARRLGYLLHDWARCSLRCKQPEQTWHGEAGKSRLYRGRKSAYPEHGPER